MDVADDVEPVIASEEPHALWDTSLPGDFFKLTPSQLGISAQSFTPSNHKEKSRLAQLKSRRRSNIGVRGSPETNSLIRYIAQQRMKSALKTPTAQQINASPFSPRASTLKQKMTSFQSIIEEDCLTETKQSHVVDGCRNTRDRPSGGRSHWKENKLPESPYPSLMTPPPSKRRCMAPLRECVGEIMEANTPILRSDSLKEQEAPDQPDRTVTQADQCVSPLAAACETQPAALTHCSLSTGTQECSFEGRAPPGAISADPAGGGPTFQPPLFTLPSLPTLVEMSPTEKYCFAGTPTSKKRKRVRFGRPLSPEFFDRDLPPSTPLQRGATPANLGSARGPQLRSALKTPQRSEPRPVLAQPDFNSPSLTGASPPLGMGPGSIMEQDIVFPGEQIPFPSMEDADAILLEDSTEAHSEVQPLDLNATFQDVSSTEPLADPVSEPCALNSPPEAESSQLEPQPEQELPSLVSQSPVLAPAPAPSPSSAPALAPSPSPALAPSPSPALAPSPSPALAPAPAPSPSSAPAPVPDPIPSPSSAPAPGPSPALAPSPSPALAPSPSPALAPSPSPPLAPSLSPAQPQSPSPALAPSPSPALAPSPSPALAPSPSPALAPSLSPALAPSLSPAQPPSPSPAQPPSPSPAQPPSPSPAQPPSPSPAPIPSPSSAPAPVPAPAPARTRGKKRQLSKETDPVNKRPTRAAAKSPSGKRKSTAAKRGWGSKEVNRALYGSREYASRCPVLSPIKETLSGTASLSPDPQPQRTRKQDDIEVGSAPSPGPLPDPTDPETAAPAPGRRLLFPAANESASATEPRSQPLDAPAEPSAICKGRTRRRSRPKQSSSLRAEPRGQSRRGGKGRKVSVPVLDWLVEENPTEETGSPEELKGGPATADGTQADVADTRHCGAPLHSDVSGDTVESIGVPGTHTELCPPLDVDSPTEPESGTVAEPKPAKSKGSKGTRGRSRGRRSYLLHSVQEEGDQGSHVCELNTRAEVEEEGRLDPAASPVGNHSAARSAFQSQGEHGPEPGFSNPDGSLPQWQDEFNIEDVFKPLATRRQQSVRRSLRIHGKVDPQSRCVSTGSAWLPHNSPDSVKEERRKTRGRRISAALLLQAPVSETEHDLAH